MGKIYTYKRIKCPFCSLEITVTNYTRHLKRHENKPESFIQHNRDNLKCEFCEKVCKNLNSLAQHSVRCPKNPNRIHSELNLKNRGWRKGLTKETDSRLLGSSLKMKEYLRHHPATFQGKKHSSSTRYKMSIIAKKSNNYLHFHGSRKKFEYKGCIFMSSYEVMVAKELDKNSVSWEQPKGIRYVTPSGEAHLYIPDFYLPAYNIYLDPKNDYLINHKNPVLGYLDTDKIAWVSEQNNVRIIILDKEHLTWGSILSLINKE